MIQLYYSVFVYLIPALLGHNLWIGPALYILLPIAVLNHAKYNEHYAGKYIVISLDRAISHIYTIKMTYDVLTFPNYLLCHSVLKIIYGMAVLYTILDFYKLKPRQKTIADSKFVHASMHVISMIGICAYVQLMMDVSK